MYKTVHNLGPEKGAAKRKNSLAGDSKGAKVIKIVETQGEEKKN